MNVTWKRVLKWCLELRFSIFTRISGWSMHVTCFTKRGWRYQRFPHSLGILLFPIFRQHLKSIQASNPVSYCGDKLFSVMSLFCHNRFRCLLLTISWHVPAFKEWNLQSNTETWNHSWHIYFHQSLLFTVTGSSKKIRFLRNLLTMLWLPQPVRQGWWAM